jgi:hypothetical protein
LICYRASRGFANVCPKCSEQSPEERARQLADAESRHKSLTASVRTNERNREEERKHDLALKRLGYKRVKKFTIK